jgi:hypothetical protein
VICASGSRYFGECCGDLCIVHCYMGFATYRGLNDQESMWEVCDLPENNILAFVVISNCLNRVCLIWFWNCFSTNWLMKFFVTKGLAFSCLLILPCLATNLKSDMTSIYENHTISVVALSLLFLTNILQFG